MEKDNKQDLANISKFMFSKTVINLDLFEHDSVKELFNYINNKDVELDKVKILIKKVNRELRMDNRRLFVRKTSGRDKKAENRICITRR